jgi:copper homeostasis protein
MKLEICANSMQSAINAQEAGADRIEFCSELQVGGVTPSYGLIKEVLASVNLPVFILIRPRGGDFVYSDAEFEIMKNDIEMCKKLGCHGIVSGILLSDNTIDVTRTQELIELSKPLPFTFHRAFDFVSNPLESLNILIKMGAQRVLTSGGEANVNQGLSTLKQWRQYANNKIIVMPGGGVTNLNVELFKDSGFLEIHTSASKPMLQNKNLMEGAVQTVSDMKTMQSILKIIRKN